jgi:hypothetical protein
MDSTTDDQMLSMAFNQDSTCFAIGTEKGFQIYNTYPFKDKFERSKSFDLSLKTSKEE